MFLCIMLMFILRMIINDILNNNDLPDTFQFLNKLNKFFLVSETLKKTP